MATRINTLQGGSVTGFFQAERTEGGEILLTIERSVQRTLVYMSRECAQLLAAALMEESGPH